MRTQSVNDIVGIWTITPFSCRPEWVDHSVTNSSHSLNGDIAIQCEWSNFDPSQNPNPLTDYDKTLHNWLRPRVKRVTQNLCQSAVRERLAKYVRPLFLIFFPDSPTGVTRAWNFTHDGSNHALWHKKVPFWGSTRWPTTFWGLNSTKTVKNGLL